MTADLFHLALVGTPNSGKTSLFNALTGGRQRVGNYPGVTVERKSGLMNLPDGTRVHLLDLPGTYSLRGRSPDEEIARAAVFGELESEVAPDLILCVADATNLRNCLRLLLELKKVGRPLALVLNMSDIAEKRGVKIDTAKMSELLGVPVIPAAAVIKSGTDLLTSVVASLLQGGDLTVGENSWTVHDPAMLRQMQQDADVIIEQSVTDPLRPAHFSGKIDKILLHPFFGLIILLGLLLVMFQAVFAGAAPFMDLIESGFTSLGEAIESFIPDGIIRSFLIDGIIAGVGGVVIFLPQILILFLFILLLEDLGYMARAAFLMDRIMGGAGLHGRAFIPLLSSFACAIPGIMATRVIDDKRDRMTTILIAPLMTCSARIPVYTLLIAAFIPDQKIWNFFNLQGIVMFGLYASGIVGALTVSFVINKILMRRKASPPFMMELPDYKLPRPKGIAIGLWLRASAFLKRAGTTIFAMSILIWILATYPSPPEGAIGPAINYSFAAMMGNMIQPFLAPLGFNWQISVALIPGMAAREVMVSALSTVYAVSEDTEAAGGIADTLKNQWSMATALSVLAWYIFAPQCAATLAVIRRELNSTKMAFVAFFYMTGLAYIASYIVYNVAVRFL